MKAELNEIHWRDGIYFKRDDHDGSVRMRVDDVVSTKTGLPLTVHIPRAEWESIVNAVALSRPDGKFTGFHDGDAYG